MTSHSHSQSKMYTTTTTTVSSSSSSSSSPSPSVSPPSDIPNPLQWLSAFLRKIFGIIENPTQTTINNNLYTQNIYMENNNNKKETGEMSSPPPSALSLSFPSLSPLSFSAISPSPSSLSLSILLFPPQILYEIAEFTMQSVHSITSSILLSNVNFFESVGISLSSALSLCASPLKFHPFDTQNSQNSNQWKSIDIHLAFFWPFTFPIFSLNSLFLFIFFALLLHGIFFSLSVSRRPKIFTAPKESLNGKLKIILKKNTPFHKILRMKYRPPFFLPTGILQTIFTAWVPEWAVKRAPVEYKREILSVFCNPPLWNGHIAVDWAISPSPSIPLTNTTPTVILLHGLAGGSSEYYVRAVAHHLIIVGGCRVVAVNQRGCGGLELQTPQAYCGSHTEDFRQAVRHIRERIGSSASLYLIGFSLGANVLCKYLGEEGDGIVDSIQGAISVSNPNDLLVSSHHLQSSFFSRYFLSGTLAKNMKKLFQTHQSAFTEQKSIDPQEVFSSKTLWDFDENFTAKTFHYPTAAHYYRDASSAPYLTHIKIPLIVLASLDDPLIPPHSIPYRECEENPNALLVVTQTGGHSMTFWEGGCWGGKPKSWMARFARAFIESMEKTHGDTGERRATDIFLLPSPPPFVSSSSESSGPVSSPPVSSVAVDEDFASTLQLEPCHHHEEMKISDEIHQSPAAPSLPSSVPAAISAESLESDNEVHLSNIQKLVDQLRNQSGIGILNDSTASASSASFSVDRSMNKSTSSSSHNVSHSSVRRLWVDGEIDSDNNNHNNDKKRSNDFLSVTYSGPSSSSSNPPSSSSLSSSFHSHRRDNGPAPSSTSSYLSQSLRMHPKSSSSVSVRTLSALAKEDLLRDHLESVMETVTLVEEKLKIQGNINNERKSNLNMSKSFIKTPQSTRGVSSSSSSSSTPSWPYPVQTPLSASAQAQIDKKIEDMMNNIAKTNRKQQKKK